MHWCLGERGVSGDGKVVTGFVKPPKSWDRIQQHFKFQLDALLFSMAYFHKIILVAIYPQHD